MPTINYIGFDIHKKTISFCVKAQDGTAETPLAHPPMGATGAASRWSAAICRGEKI